MDQIGKVRIVAGLAGKNIEILQKGFCNDYFEVLLLNLGDNLKYLTGLDTDADIYLFGFPLGEIGIIQK